MKLSKFMRKNSRMLIMVFMSLLLIAFLVPQSITSMRGRGMRKARIGTAFGEVVTNYDVMETNADLDLLSTSGVLQVRVPPDRVLDFHLLIKEAEHAGVRVGRDEVRKMLIEAGVTDRVLNRLQRRTSRGYDEIFDIMGRWFAVQRLQGMQQRAVASSLVREEANYRAQTQEAETRIAVIDDDAFLDQLPEPTEEQLQAFFEECKARTTAHTTDELVFGYLRPDRVKLEYLTVDSQKIKSEVKIKSVKVKQYFEENAAKYTKPDPLAAQPAGQPRRVSMTYDEARDQVREDYRAARAFELAQSLVNEMYTEAHRPWSGAADEDGFVEPPAEIVSFPEFQDRYSSRFAVEYGSTDLVSSEELRRIANLGGASLSMGPGAFVPVHQLAMRAKGLYDREDDPNRGVPTLSVMEPAPVVFTRTFDYQTSRRTPIQAYLFRVTEVSPSAPPDSLDDVRERLIADWKMVQAHEVARQHAEALAAAAREMGLEAAVQQASELKQKLEAAEVAATQPAGGARRTKPQYVRDLGPFTPGRALTRRYPYLERVGVVSETFNAAVFALADAPATGSAPAHQVACLPVASESKWVVVELNEIKPLYAGAFEQQLARSARQSRDMALSLFGADWFDGDSIKRRTGFVYEPGREPKQQAAATP